MRLDLHHLLAEQSFTAFDFRSMLQMMNGLDRNYVINGMIIVGLSGLTASIEVKNAMLLCPLNGITSFYTATSDDPTVEIVVPPSIDKIFIEAYFEKVTQVPVTTAIFDPSSTTPATPAGTEFTAPVDFQEVVQLNFRYQINGFSADSIPIAIVKTNSTAIMQVTDARNMFFRLGTGGAAPDPYNKFLWSTQREETNNPGAANDIGQFSSGNPYFSSDATGAKNDKAIQTLKQWMDAVMTVLSEIKGTPTWYFPTVGQTIPNLLFLTGNATSVVPTLNRTIQWSRSNDNKVRAKGTGFPTSWAMNFGTVQWYLGNTFTSASSRKFSDKDWSFTINDKEAFFVLLQRETIPAGTPGNSVTWGSQFISTDISITALPIARQVKGQPGDFTGIAIGDYVRKEGDQYYKYYRVVGIAEAGVASTWDPVAQTIAMGAWGQVATSGCTGLILERDVEGTSAEPYKWFRSAYSAEDMYKTASSDSFKVQSNSLSPLVLPIDDINLYWLGRRSSDAGTNLLMLRDYGNMSPGEETPWLDDSAGGSQMFGSEIYLNLNHGSAISGAGALDSLTSTIATITRRKSDNLIDVGLGNQNAIQGFTFTEPSTLSFSADGDGLWVRLDDNQIGTSPLIAGVVDPAEPTVPVLNVYQILPFSTVPLRSPRNWNVFLVARRVTLNGVVSLQFWDGTVLQSDGVALQRDITKVITGITTSTTVTSAVTHGYLRNNFDFLWNARRTSTNRIVGIGATHTATGLTLDATPGGAENLTVVFSRSLT